MIPNLFVLYVPIAIQFTVLLPLPLDPDIHTWKLEADSLCVFSTLMPLDEALLANDTTMMGFAEKPESETVVHETPDTVVDPYFTLKGSRAAAIVPEVMALPA